MNAAKMLIVTPDRSLAECLYLALAQPGAFIKLAYDGVAAARRLVDWRPGLVVVDDRIAGVGGWSLAELVALEPHGGDSRLIVLAGSDSYPSHTSGVETVARDKPIADIVSRLHAVLAGRGASDLPPAAESPPTEQPIALRDVLPIGKTNFGGIPTPVGSRRSGGPLVSNRSAGVARQQTGTQQPRLARPRPGMHADPPQQVAPRIGGLLSVGEYHLIDAAFEAFPAAKSRETL